MVRWRTAFDQLTERIIDLVEAGAPVTRGSVENAAHRAIRDAMMTRPAVSRYDQDDPPRWDMAHPRDYPFLPLYVGMTTTDWQDLEPEVMAFLRRGNGDPLAEAARRLRRRGESAGKIARLLGVSPRQVGRYLQGD